MHVHVTQGTCSHPTATSVIPSHTTCCSACPSSSWLVEVFVAKLQRQLTRINSAQVEGLQFPAFLGSLHCPRVRERPPAQGGSVGAAWLHQCALGALAWAAVPTTSCSSAPALVQTPCGAEGSSALGSHGANHSLPFGNGSPFGRDGPGLPL